VQGRLVRERGADREQGEALITLLRHGWGRPGSAFLKAFASLFIPGGTSEQIDYLATLQRETTTADNALALRSAFDRIDVSHLLGRISVPTLVIHADADGVHPIEQGRRLAAGIPGARFLALDSLNHVVLAHEPAWHTFFEGLDRFVAE
jgi:pimeloyl-ACP methyl ester carboxylesterase